MCFVRNDDSSLPPGSVKREWLIIRPIINHMLARDNCRNPMLNHWPLGKMVVISKWNVRTHINNLVYAHSRNCCHVNITKHLWRYVNKDSVHYLVPLDKAQVHVCYALLWICVSGVRCLLVLCGCQEKNLEKACSSPFLSNYVFANCRICSTLRSIIFYKWIIKTLLLGSTTDCIAIFT